MKKIKLFSVLFLSIILNETSAQTYCNPNHWGAAFGHYVSNVTIGGINNTTGGTDGVKQDYTGGTDGAMSQGSSYSISFSAKQVAWATYLYVFIDWNDDGDWLDASENIVNGQAVGTGTGTYTWNNASYTCPTIATGTVRMRVISSFYSSGSHPCYDWDYGEFEDYEIVVSPAGSPPTVGTTVSASSITCNAASSGGQTLADNGSSITVKGVCWNTGGSPTTASSKTTDGSGTSNFTSSITGLSASTTYYVRAYATNSLGTSYGPQISFTTAASRTVGAASSTPTLCISTALTNITHSTTGVTAISSAGLPGGVNASYASNTITISGTPTVSGTFNYTITPTDCGTATATGTITVTANRTVAAASSTPTLCINTALTNITHATTGVTGAGSVTGGALPGGVTHSYASNTITISGTPTATGTFNYTITPTGCGSATATGTITVTADRTVAAASSTPTLCINTALTNITHATTDVTGAGSVTGGALPGGVTHSYASNTITISGTPTASGTFNYTITPTGCGSATATGTITVTADRTVGAASSTPTLCINTALTNITHATTGVTGAGSVTGGALPGGVTHSYASNTITISGTPTASGTFNYTITPTGCGAATATGTITVTADRTVAAASSTPTLCINTALTNITHATTGVTAAGTVTGGALPGGVTHSYASNTITISGTPTATGTFSYTITPTSTCGSATATGTITVTADRTVGAASSTPTLCINTALTNITHATTGVTGAGSVTGGALPGGVTHSYASNTITISGTPTATGTFNYTITPTGCGAATATGTITVTADRTVGAASSTPAVCINTALTNITHATTGVTGAGSVTGGALPGGVTHSYASNTITISGTPTASGTFNYTITPTSTCGSATAIGTIIVSPVTVGGTVSSDAALCSGNNSGTLTLTGHTGSVERWESSPDNFTTTTTIVNTTTSQSYTNLTVETNYRAVVQSGSCASANSSAATLTITPALDPGVITF